MSAKSRMKVEWKGGADGLWLVTGGKLEASVEVSMAELKSRFPLFHAAACEYCEMESSQLKVEDLDALIGCAASTLGEIVPARQRFSVYQAVACLFGYMDREKLPQVNRKLLYELHAKFSKVSKLVDEVDAAVYDSYFQKKESKLLANVEEEAVAEDVVEDGSRLADSSRMKRRQARAKALGVKTQPKQLLINLTVHSCNSKIRS
ncbi:hypothetical protein R1flu_010848 [Riccia fluitans]|uniref:Uncharacterized protein n=1 Tax=Riccia fluitans TaxID=41844 RepID=A0ABD1Z6H1_9MARC